MDRTLILMSPLNRPGSRLADMFSAFVIGEVHRLTRSEAWPGTAL